jgi:CRP/FNR family transcriptional regulator
VCAVLQEDELAELSRVSRRRHLAPHEPIFAEGEEAGSYFSVVRGIVKLVKTLADGEQHIVGLMYPPDFLVQALAARHTCSAEAATEVELCVFPRAAFDTTLRNNAKLERRLLEFTLRELEICRDWTLLLGRKSAYERVASFLYVMSRKAALDGCGDDNPFAVVFHLPFTRAEMADYLGLTLETVSRQLSRLKAHDVIELREHRMVAVPNLELLSAVARIDSCLADSAVDQAGGKM